MSTDDEKLSAVHSYLDRLSANTTVLSLPSASSSNDASDPPLTHSAESDGLTEILKEHGLLRLYVDSIKKSQEHADSLGRFGMRTNDASLHVYPCAHVVANEAWCCPKEGTLRCKACTLVSYCSKECQVKHWKVHKQDCKDKIRSSDWKPSWVVEKRTPTFMDSGERTGNNWLANVHPLGFGVDLWGNVPAVDILKLSANENSGDQDLALAFPASGDLRNVIRSVNELPSDYTGELTILLNDRQPFVVLRNVLLLLVLGKVADKSRAADLALHFWYSAYVPMEYHIQMVTVILELLESAPASEDGRFGSDLGDRSSISGILRDSVRKLLGAIMLSTYEIQDVSKEISRVRFAPDSVDRHHRRYCRLEPSHRLSLLEFRRFGLLLPFGARNDHFNHPNRFLFSPEGRWMQTDTSSPLGSWDISAVMEVGKRHGASRADLYGCLHFYLSEQLLEFAERLSRFRISFKVFDMDAVALSKSIRNGELSRQGVPATMRFDRIDVSNIIDEEYVGLERTCEAWGPMLKETEHATLVAYSMNWAAHCDGARPGSAAIGPLTEKFVDEGKGTFTAAYDNSEAFRAYLEDKNLKAILRRTKLKLKANHTIVPHRIGVPVDAPASALPVFPDKESWYLRAHVVEEMWSERYIELSRLA
ncbi:hypothetical protein BV25DRAFT_1868112 [Artomyces pyxidatus]|uniref:Uncharacterized protein n=1 Tax=Artomyces pyxidatus TaxID=48021 RepID=A0ACB8TF98_9AGAM|nr:hypothetical protein BV25DRAFT_1868112 [Artomyces pyxidatus]